MLGSSRNLYQRLLRHFALLRHNKHENAHLRSAWNKYGEESFEWFILELLGGEYNITKKVERNILSEESRMYVYDLVGISPSSICRVTNGTYQQCKGYRFSYKLERLSPLEVKSNKQNTKYDNYRHCPTIE